MIHKAVQVIKHKLNAITHELSKEAIEKIHN